MEVVPTLACVGIVFEDVVVPGTETILIPVRNVDCAEMDMAAASSDMFFPQY